jgi:hypothetical protein
MTRNKRHDRPPAKRKKPEPRIPELYQVVVQCADEDDQRKLYKRLTAENRTCRLIIL